MNEPLSRLKARAVAGALALLLALPAAGCRSLGKPYSARFASVEIPGRSPAQIRDATVAVFRDERYAVASAGLTDLVFEREASGFSNVAYGNWMGGTPVYVRVKVAIVPLADGVHRLQCDAYMVRDKGDALVEEEVKLSIAHGGPYQKLLDKAAGRLK